MMHLFLDERYTGLLKTGFSNIAFFFFFLKLKQDFFGFHN